MIGKKLRELGEYIEKIDSFKPGKLLETHLIEVEKDLMDIPREQLEFGEKFGNDIIKVVKEHSKKGTSNSIILSELYNIVYSYARKSMIETRADLLGINRRMYKAEMNLLFKGRKI